MSRDFSPLFKIKSLKILDGYFFSKNLNIEHFNKISKLVSNRVSQIVLTEKNIDKALSNYSNFNWAIEIKFLPGVTDNISTTGKKTE